MFQSLKVNNLRAVTELEVENLGQINLFVGQNNCGKTTLLEALFFLIGATNPRLPLNVNIFRGLEFLRSEWWDTFFHNLDSSMSIVITGQLSEKKEKQRLSINPILSKQVSSESLDQNMVSVDANGGDSKPAIMPEGLELTYINSKDASAITKSRIVMKDNQLITEGMKESTKRGIFVGPATRFDWKMRFSSIQRKKKINDLISSLKEIDQSIVDIRLNEVGILEVDMGLPSLIPVNLLGGGMANFLSVALAMLDSKDGIVLIDEIENGLHYSILNKLWQVVFKWSKDLNVQVFATTHSYECIKAFSAYVDTTLFESEAKLYRIERKDGKFRAVDYSKENLTESLESDWEIR